MIIKHYPKELGGCINIYEDVTDVLIHQNLFNGTELGPELGGDMQPRYHISPVVPDYGYGKADDTISTVRFIDFTRNGIRTRLRVDGTAYVCNDSGRTIEKVTA